MKVSVKSNVKLDRDSIELKSPATLRSLLEILGKDLPFLLPEKIPGNKWVVVSLNQKEISLLPEGVGTAIKDGDQMEIAISSFSGG